MAKQSWDYVIIGAGSAGALLAARLSEQADRRVLLIVEHWTGPSHPARGTEGPLHVRRFDETDAACAATREALIDLGVPHVEDYAVGVDEGVGATQATQKHGWRHSIAGAYLHPARRPM